MSIAVVKLSMDTHSSRSRIKLLEKNDSAPTRLVHVFGKLEKSMEDAMADLVDEAGNSDSQVASAEALSHPRTVTAAETSSNHVYPPTPEEPVSSSSSVKSKSTTPDKILTEGQQRIIANLNTIPQLKKERVFIHPVINSHATIVARDIQRFKFHELGHGVLRHMADHFIV